MLIVFVILLVKGRIVFYLFLPSYLKKREFIIEIKWNRFLSHKLVMVFEQIKPFARRFSFHFFLFILILEFGSLILELFFQMTTLETSNPWVNLSIDDTDSTIESQITLCAIHHTYLPVNVLVTQQLLGASNYNSWGKVMILTFSGKNKFYFLDGSIKELVGNWFAAWKCNNDIIASWRMSFASKEIVARSCIY